MGLRVRSFRKGEIVRLEKQVRDDGSGDLLFVLRDGAAPVPAIVRGGLAAAHVPAIGFTGVRDLAAVERLVRPLVGA